MVTPVALRNVNDVSYHVCQTSYCDFSWQAQYLVTLERESCCSAQGA